MTTGHASVEVLAAYAAGALSEGMSLLVASHITFCPECRRAAALFDCVGGAILTGADPAPPAPACLAGALARIARDETAPPRPAVVAPAGSGSPFPAPLRARLGVEAADIRWRFLLPGLSEHRLDGFGGEEVKLLRARPGVRILRHTHVGEEATLILSGRMRDGDREFARGDLALADEADDHHPEIVGSETCICLVALSGPMRFTGPVGRALNFFT